MMDYGRNFRAPKVSAHDFSMIPRSDIPRSSFRMDHQHKTTIGCSYLYPIYLKEILPGDTFNVSASAVIRTATFLYPMMDQVDVEMWFFFVPNRLVWIHWPNFMGEQNSFTDSISYSVPQVVSPVGGFAQLSIFDYFGIPCSGQIAGGNTITISALPFRGFNLIYQEWFRDQNLQVARATGTAGNLASGAKWMCQSDDGPDPYTQYDIPRVNKRHDYFTSCLPWTQKGNTAVTLPLGTTATVKTNATDLFTGVQTGLGLRMLVTGTGAAPAAQVAMTSGTAGANQNTVWSGTAGGVTSATPLYPSNLYADLSTATAATINSIRLAFQTQRLLERDARGGTRYTESLHSHFGVRSPDARLMRPEYLGGGIFPVNIAPVPQTTQTGLTGGSSPLGTLAGAGMARGHVGFSHSFVEHGYVFGLVAARNNKLYQQGIQKHWKRLTRYDFFLPVFSHLGEQSVFNYELFADGSANDALTFGYIARWDEYRYHPSMTSGYFDSKNTTPLDAWHTGQSFAALPVLNSTFMADDLAITFRRNLAAGATADSQQLLCDFFFQERCARAMPMYGVPGFVDRF